MVGRFYILSILWLLLSASTIPAQEELPVPEMCMKIMLSGVKPALELQGEEGRYYWSLEQKKNRYTDMYHHTQMVIYPLAFLYTTEHPLNKYYGDRRLLDSVVRNGDHLAGLEPKIFLTHWPLSQWLVYTWLEAYELIRNDLTPEKRRRWESRFEHWCNVYAGYLEKTEGKREFLAPQLGTSTNHYSYFAIAVFRAGQILQRPEWVELARRAFENLFRSQHRDGYWSEHSGPVNRYVWHTLHGIGVYHALTGDPEALEAMRRAKDFLLKFNYPDGTPVSVIDERNRYQPLSAEDERQRYLSYPIAVSGLISLSHFSDGRRFGRLMTRKIFDTVKQEKEILSAVNLSRYADACRYWVEGPESTIPQEMESYEARLVSGAYLMRRGEWYVTLSGIISPPWEGNRFFLDRYTYLEIWHAKTGLLIGGGLTKHQPQIATVLMQQSNGAVDFRPRETRIVSSGDTAAIQIELDKFRASVEVVILGRKKLSLKTSFIETTEPILWPNRYECNLQLQLEPGEKIVTGAGNSFVLSENRLRLKEKEIGPTIETNLWRITLPQEKTSLRFPFMPHHPYDLDGYGGLNTAVGILSSFALIEEPTLEYVLEIK